MRTPAALEEAGIDTRNATRQTGQELKTALETLLVRAQQAGAVRADMGLAEVMVLLAATSRAAEHHGGDHAVRSKTLEIVFDGLRHR